MMFNQDFMQQSSLGSLPVVVEQSRFIGSSGVAEYFVSLVPDRYADFETQLAWVRAAYDRLLSELGLSAGCAVWRRFHCSDLQNQAPSLAGDTFSDDRMGGRCAVSWVGQAPVGEARVALSAYLIEDAGDLVALSRKGEAVALDRGSQRHFWRMGMCSPGQMSSGEQSRSIFGGYCDEIDRLGMTLLDNVVRTWLWVKDVDNNYQGLVDARNEVFADEGLGQDCHTIASTGIEGEGVCPDQLVTMDAYAIAGLRAEQVNYLSALDHLSPTQLYGVAFERATSVAYRDRRHVFVSGTASIDWQGRILHEGDVERQLARVLENVSALLAEAGMDLGAMAVFTVYVRDPSDLPFVQQRMKDEFPGVPMVVVKAPVCRPGWLVEIEGIAIGEHRDETLPPF